MSVSIKAGASSPKVKKFDYEKAFQAKLLRVLYQDQDFTCTTGTRLSPEHFESKVHRWIADQILAYAQRHGHGIGKDALLITLDRSIKKHPRRWNDDLVDATRESIDALDRKVKERSFIKEELFRFIKHQVTRDVILKSIEHIEAEDYDALDQEFGRVLDVQSSLDGGLGQFFVRDVDLRTTKRIEYVKNGVSTGLKLDNYLKPGGLPPKALGCVIAPSGKGKTHILVHLGRSAIIDSNVKVLHVTLELSEDMVLDRYDAAFSGIPVGRLEDKPKSVRKAIREVGRQYGDCLVVKEFPPATLTVPALKAYIRQLERIAFYPGMIIVDYADLLRPTQYGRDRDTYEEMGAMYQELRALSYVQNCPVWTASQTTRDALNKEFFDWDSIADSAKKAHVSDLMIAFQQTVDEKKRKMGRLGVSKNRLGPDKFDVPVRTDWSRSILRSM